MTIRVLICDDQEIVTEGLATILNTAPGIDVVGTAHNGAQAVEMVGLTTPDVVLMDLKMPVMNGVKATQAIREGHPEVRVLVLTTYDADEWVFDAIRNGAAGYLLKDTPSEQLIQAIEDTAAGRSPVDPGVAGRLFDRIRSVSAAPQTPLADSLSERELDVLKLLARGLSNGAIADRLALSEGTIRNYVSALFDKLGVQDRTQAAVLAIRHGLVTDIEEG